MIKYNFNCYTINRRLSAEPGLKKRLPHFVCADFFSFLNLPTASIYIKSIYSIIINKKINHNKKNNFFATFIKNLCLIKQNTN